MGKFVKVAKTSEMNDREVKAVELEGNSIAMVNADGKVYAIDAVCPHQEGPLGEGRLEEGAAVVTCPWHGWQFDMTIGRCLTGPDVEQKQFKVKIEGEDILIEI